MRRSRALAALGIVAGLLIGAPTPGAAETNPNERGPAPTAASVVEREGPLAYAQVEVVGSSAIGFARGTVWYPVEGGPYAVVVAVPGVVWPGSFLAWIGPYLASNGFVVMTLDPFSAFDGTASTQLPAFSITASAAPNRAPFEAASALRNSLWHGA